MRAMTSHDQPPEAASTPSTEQTCESCSSEKPIVETSRMSASEVPT